MFEIELIDGTIVVVMQCAEFCCDKKGVYYFTHEYEKIAYSYEEIIRLTTPIQSINERFLAYQKESEK